MKSILEREKANAKPNLDRIARLEEMTIFTEITAAGRPKTQTRSPTPPMR